MGRIAATISALAVGAMLALFVVISRNSDDLGKITHKTSYALVMITRGETSVNVSTIPGFSSTKNCEVVAGAITATNTNMEIEVHCEPVW